MHTTTRRPVPLAAAVLSLALPSVAGAFSLAKARLAVEDFFGPGTTASCHRATPHSAICNYSTPNTLFENENETPSGMYRGTCRVIEDRGRYRPSCPGFS
jgi:hypothetical protein